MHVLVTGKRCPTHLAVPQYSDGVDSQLSYFPLSLSIRLQMVGGCRHQRRFQRDAYGIEKFPNKLQPVIRQQPLGYTIRNGPAANKNLGNDCRSRLLCQYRP